MDDSESFCRPCNEPIHDLNHKNSVNHRFNFFKWSYNEYRKALINDRHGITLEVEPEQINNFHFDFHHIKGKYKTKVSPQQLQLHNNTITFNCKIKNTTKKPVYVTCTDLLHDSNYFSIVHLNDFGEDENAVLKLQPGSCYKFKVVFSTDILTCASYKIPLICNFQTDDDDDDKDKKCFTIVRTFLTIVDDQDDAKQAKKKSPFTSKPWADVTNTVPTTKETSYEDRYPIPGHYKRLLTYGLCRFDGMNVNDENTLRELSQLLQTLRQDNYNKFWHILLWLEERAQELMLMKYNMEGVTMLIHQCDILIIEVPGLSEKRPSVIVGDFIRIKISGDHTAYKGFVCKVNERTVEISHVDEDLLEYLAENPGTEMDVSFMLSRLAFERMHHAVDMIVETGMVQKLFPPNIVNVRTRVTQNLQDSQFFNQSVCNNVEQKNAVNRILNSVQDLPYIVFGPPGTGKSITIVEAILQIKKRTKKKILVCAPANSACDMLAIKLMRHCTKEELIRIHSTTRERTTITEELMAYSNMEDDEFTKVTIDKLLSYRIVVTTLTLIGRFAKDYRPDCVFVDEAAQASEPETDIAISLLSIGKQVVLAGDPKQLGPMATASAAKFGFGVSLLERLMKYKVYEPKGRNKLYDTNFITMLRSNFRSHPDILLIPNDLFYDNLLLPVSLIPQRDPIVDIAIYPKIGKRKGTVKGRAIEFCSVSGKDKKEGSSPSYFNLFEAKLIVKYVQALTNLHLAEAYKVRVDQIGIVTPYKRQVHKIQDGLRHNGFSGVEVGTTESFQGREKRIIIISTVRAQHSQLLLDKKYNLGFVKNDQRFNVALTRAISKLIIVGCPLVLRTDEKWARYMDLCDEYKTYFGNSFAKDNQEFRESVLEKSKHFKYKDDQYNK